MDLRGNFSQSKAVDDGNPLWLAEETNVAMRKISRKDKRSACEDMFLA
jgi:hypothetical protein